jgi:hypothetical protein
MLFASRVMIAKIQTYSPICGQACENRKVERGINCHYDVWRVVGAFALASEQSSLMVHFFHSVNVGTELMV